MENAELKVEYMPVGDLKQYSGNAKRHPKKQVAEIRESIEQFGFNDPIAIWKNGEIIEGHGRLLAALEMGMDKVPVIRLDSLTDEERRAYVLAHNQTTLSSGYDTKILKAELEKLPTIDMSKFGFDAEALEGLHEEFQELTQKRVENIVNLGKSEYIGVGKYDIPEILPETELPEIKEWIGFNYVLSDENPEGKAVHFFIDDYQFERIWKEPEKYVEKLKKYACVASPDFSPYGDMPQALQIYNHYRKHWVAAFLQERGVKVIPTIRCSSDVRSLEWFLEGEPHGGIVIISSMWVGEEDNYFQSVYDMMYDTLKPTLVLVYGKEIKGIRGNIMQVQSFAQKRWGK